MGVVVYTMPNCRACEDIKNRLNVAGLEFTTVENMDEIIAKSNEVGSRAMPLVFIDGEYKNNIEVLKMIKFY